MTNLLQNTKELKGAEKDRYLLDQYIGACESLWGAKRRHADNLASYLQERDAAKARYDNRDNETVVIEVAQPDDLPF